MNRRDLSIFLLITLLPAASAPADELLAHGTAEMYWVARVVEPASTPGESDVRTIIRARTVGGEGRWGTVAQPRSRIVSL